MTTDGVKYSARRIAVVVFPAPGGPVRISKNGAFTRKIYIDHAERPTHLHSIG